MSKQYFAKYLPAEGEIEPGDFYLFYGKITQCNVSILKELEELYGRPMTEYQKVKLFLCSRGIKVGDEVAHIETNTKFKVIHIDIVSQLISPPIVTKYLVGGNFAYKQDECVKPIGEISSAAIWVKEGMEFDEDDIYRKVLVKDYLGEDDYTELNTYRIKGTDVVGDGKQCD